jgi:hypothetical protein
VLVRVGRPYAVGECTAVGGEACLRGFRRTSPSSIVRSWSVVARRWRALACAQEQAKWGNEEVIYTYDESAWGNA